MKGTVARIILNDPITSRGSDLRLLTLAVPSNRRRRSALAAELVKLDGVSAALRIVEQMTMLKPGVIDELTASDLMRAATAALDLLDRAMQQDLK